MEAVLCLSRVCKNSQRIALICTCFYTYTLIYEACIEKLVANSPADSIIEVKPLQIVEQSTYYYLSEINTPCTLR